MALSLDHQALGIPAPPTDFDGESPKDYGWFLCDHFDAEQCARWERKLVFPKREQLEQVQHLLKQGNGKSFSELVRSISEPVTRLVAIHTFNALIANGVSFANARTVDLRDWGATTGFFAMEAPFSLLPLLGAYCPRDLYESYASAFESLALDDLAPVRHSQVRDFFASLIKQLAGACEA